MGKKMEKPLTEPMVVLVRKLLRDADAGGVIAAQDWDSGSYSIQQKCALIDRGIITIDKPMVGPFRLNRADPRVQAIAASESVMSGHKID